MLDPLANEIEAGERDFTLAGEDSQKLCVMEALALIIQHGWSLRRACELTGADPSAVKPKIHAPGPLAPIPTPEQIAEQCREFRRIHNRSRLAGNPPPREPKIREYCAVGGLEGEPAEFI